ncbi:HEPN domain-containing protein [Consotaella salsifontis]|uniref:Uncharacterized protein n=1 Tax=Consotaella salsifontis TaxID=1365950 RepID=A0A1T4T1C3_9HYPH|nr:HEPN domain-containing protein [Consotaella salsifontis]SKA34294.1 hypothetical protein SAMN05428963_11713 [Consotaella salsifontis]
MTPEQKRSTTEAIADLRTVSSSGSEPHDANSFRDMMEAGGIANGFIDWGTGDVTGYSADGLASINALAKSYRPEGSQRSHQTSNATLAQVIAAAVATAWRTRHDRTPVEADFNGLHATIESWFFGLTQKRLHAVPCVLVDYQVPPFAIGPVHFYHVTDFPHDQFGVAREEFWPEAANDAPQHEIGGLNFGSLIQMANERCAAWMAVVEVSGRAEKESIAIADIAVDIALGALQVAAPGLHIENITRATACLPLRWRADVWAQNDQTRHSISNHQVARGIHPATFAHVTGTEVAQQLSVMGGRLAGYLGSTSAVPLLDEAWCNAVYWFHEAIAETLDTVAVVKLETAIEVLFRAEDMKGSKNRIKSSFEALFGLKESDILPGSSLTVEKFVLNITTARSRVVHGTWPTIHTDLPGYRKQQPISRSDLQAIASILLIHIAHHIEAYLTAGETNDDTDALLSWIKTQPQAAAPASPQAPAAPPPTGGEL